MQLICWNSLEFMISIVDSIWNINKCLPKIILISLSMISHIADSEVLFCIKGKSIDWNEFFKLEISILHYSILSLDGFRGLYKHISSTNKYICYIASTSAMEWGRLETRYQLMIWKHPSPLIPLVNGNTCKGRVQFSHYWSDGTKGKKWKVPKTHKSKI